MKIISSKSKILYIFCISFVFIFIGSAVGLTNSFQLVFSQGYIPPPPLTTSTNQNDQISKNNNNPSTSNIIGSSSSSSSGQSQLNQDQQPPTFTIPPSQTTSCSEEVNQSPSASNQSPSASMSSANDDCKSQQKQLDSNCNTKLMVGCGISSPSNTTSTTNQSPQTNTSDTTNTGSSTGSNSFGPNQPSTTLNPNTNLGGGTVNQLANPTAYNYQTNPATASVDISKDPTQKINSKVTNSFGQGVPNIPVTILVKDPDGKDTAAFRGKTDNDGKNVFSFPVKTAGTWTALVVISSSKTVGGPFLDHITWNAMSDSTSHITVFTSISNFPDDSRFNVCVTIKKEVDTIHHLFLTENANPSCAKASKLGVTYTVQGPGQLTVNVNPTYVKINVDDCNRYISALQSEQCTVYLHGYNQ
jgi:hypothetical protein